MIAALALNGFVVTALGSDGASENCVLFKDLATLSVKDLVEMKKLPVSFLNYNINDFPVAFWHQTYKGKTLIFIQSDMPHIGKKLLTHLNNPVSRKERLTFVSKVKKYHYFGSTKYTKPAKDQEPTSCGCLN